jgi:hypothetical protein
MMNNMAKRETVSVYADTSVFGGMFDDKNPHGPKPILSGCFRSARGIAAGCRVEAWRDVATACFRW